MLGTVIAAGIIHVDFGCSHFISYLPSCEEVGGVRRSVCQSSYVVTLAKWCLQILTVGIRTRLRFNFAPPTREYRIACLGFSSI